jgi:cell division septum initiation protein DivIVA
MSDEATMDGGHASDMSVELSQQPNSIFRRALLGGYKIQDVEQYTERANQVIENLMEENKELKVKIDSLREGGITMRTALASAVNFSENIADAARRETTHILDSAKAQQQRTDDEEFGTPQTLAQEIEALRTHRDRITSELNNALESHIRLLDSIETNLISEDTLKKVNELLKL